MKKMLLSLTGIGLLMLSALANAQSVLTYDIKNGVTPNLMTWPATYSGAITPNSNLSGYDYGRPGGLSALPLFDYTGGSGTLNDGAKLDKYPYHFFFSSMDQSSITLHLSSPSTIHTIDFFSPTTETALGNAYGSGNLSGATISFGGQSVSLSSDPWGPTCYLTSCNDRFNLLGTSLDGMVTDTITISNFSVSRPELDPLFFVSEITVNGAANGGLPSIPAVPEPQTYAMLLGGLAVAGFMARRRKQATREA
ncbi:PEP-CTERM sorting domain-containing protein [Janthinobacterium sp. GB4P2]